MATEVLKLFTPSCDISVSPVFFTKSTITQTSEPPSGKKIRTKLLLQKRISKCVELKINSPNAEQASGIMTEDLNRIFI